VTILTRLTIAMITVVAIAGCSAARHEIVETTTRVERPESGMSLIFFIRAGAPNRFPGPVVMDGDSYLGTVPTWGHLAYVTQPGRHMFAVVSEAADFLQADLEPDKIYYANVRQRSGVWESRYSFVAHNEASAIDAARGLVLATPQVRSTDAGREWFEKNRELFERLRSEYLPVWQTNPTKQVLQATSGR
jgi:hypothetical protein